VLHGDVTAGKTHSTLGSTAGTAAGTSATTSSSTATSMITTADGPGLIPRLCSTLFDRVQPGCILTGEQGETVVDATVHVSFCEIYNEMVSSECCQLLCTAASWT
jgi:Kinesin motor domain